MKTTRTIDKYFIGLMLDSRSKAEDGGKGSGNFGHKGRPGLRGGSGKGGGMGYKGANKRVSAKELSSLMSKAKDASSTASVMRKWSLDKRMEYFYESTGKHVDNPPPQPHKSFRYYTWHGDVLMNHALRGNGTEKITQEHLNEQINSREATLKCIKQITDNMKPLQDDVMLARGISTPGLSLATLGLNMTEEQYMKALNNPDFIDSLTGYTFRDNGFSSTTIKDVGFLSKAGGIQMNIFAPKGTLGAYIGNNSEFTSEREFLLQRGTQFAITGAKMVNGRLELDVSVIGQEPQPIPEQATTLNPSVSENEGKYSKQWGQGEQPQKQGEQPKQPETPTSPNVPIGVSLGTDMAKNLIKTWPGDSNADKFLNALSNIKKVDDEFLTGIGIDPTQPGWNMVKELFDKVDDDTAEQDFGTPLQQAKGCLLALAVANPQLAEKQIPILWTMMAGKNNIANGKETPTKLSLQSASDVFSKVSKDYQAEKYTPKYAPKVYKEEYAIMNKVFQNAPEALKKMVASQVALESTHPGGVQSSLMTKKLIVAYSFM